MPEKHAVYEDYRRTLFMVPDVQSFPEAVAGIDFASGAYRVEITDSNNALLEEEQDSDQDEQGQAEDLANENEEHTASRAISAAMSAQGGQIPLEVDTTFRLFSDLRRQSLTWSK